MKKDDLIYSVHKVHEISKDGNEVIYRLNEPIAMFQTIDDAELFVESLIGGAFECEMAIVATEPITGIYILESLMYFDAGETRADGNGIVRVDPDEEFLHTVLVRDYEETL